MPTQSLATPLDINTLHALKKGGFILFGTLTLVSGVATVTDRRIQTGSVSIVSYATPAGTMGANLKAACAQGTLTVTSVKSDATTQTADTSKVAYFLVI